jgi:shikimate kinase
VNTVSAPFQEKFNAWIDKALSKPVPESVIAFSFNLAEPWCVELVGADNYSDDDSDWACPPEAFRTKGKKFALPESEVGSKWQPVLEAAKSMVSAYLNHPSPGSDRLKKAVAVVVGFVDGDLCKVWPA